MVLVAFPHQKNKIILKWRKVLSWQGWEVMNTVEPCPSRGETRAYLAWCRLCQEGQALAEGNGDADDSGWLSENLVACQE